jgi:hypothetical protein
MLVRAYASTLKVIEMPFTYNYLPFPVEGSLKQYYKFRGFLNAYLSPFSLYFVIFSLLIASSTSVRMALCFLLIILFIGGTPSIQFSGRHFFHLEIIAWASLLFTLEQSIKYVVRFIKVTR